MSGYFKGYTGLIVLINVVAFFIFAVASILFNQDLLYYLFALQPVAILSGSHLWAFLTSMFLHAGVGHLFANMVSLLFLGGFVEKLIGKKRFIWLYMIGGLFAGLFFVILAGFFGNTDIGAKLFGTPQTLAVGASGAIFALGGLLAVLTPRMKVLLFFVIPMPMWVAMIGMLAVLWLFSLALPINVGNTAHFGGLIAGVAYGFYLKYRYPKKTQMISQYFN